MLSRVGGPECLELAELPDPEPGPGEVLVAVRAAGVNYADVLIRSGKYPQPPPLPYVPGHEFAGDIVAVGDRVDGVGAGGRVMAFTRGDGAYAERAVVPAANVVALPDDSDYAEGAGFLLTFLTAYIPLVRQIGIRPGQTVLVHAAAGGVGTAALQILRHFGATAIATAGSTEKLEFARSLGATTAIDYRREDFAARVREETNGRGVDVVLDTVGGEIFEQSLRVLAPLGTLVAIGFAGGSWPQLDPGVVVGRNVTLVGFFLGRLFRLAPDYVAQATRELVELWASGAVRPIVTRRLPLAEAAEAHRLIESRRTMGKVVLIP